MSISSTEPTAPTADGAVAWQPWGTDAFAAAQQRDRPILLSINGVWCNWCHEMERGTYGDAEVARFVNEHFTPIRVDTDHRPDINARYNVGGWPTTSFLTPHGGYIAGATYLPPDQFLAMLDEVRRAYAERKPELYEQANDILRQRREHAGRVAAGREPDASLVDAITRRVAGTYDPINGGFGVEPKFPSAPMLRLLLHKYRTTGETFFRVMLEKSLDAITGGALHDDVDGGFFRFVTGAGWTEAQHEKMAEDNIALAGVLMEAGIALQRPDYTRVAGETVDYICETLFDTVAVGIRGSQGAHSDYYGHPAEVRAGMPAPEVDPFCYSPVTARAASLFFSAAWQLGRPELTGVAVSLLDRLVEMAGSGDLPHVYGGTDYRGTDYRGSDYGGSDYGGSAISRQEGGNLLNDWACFLIAALDGYDAVAVGGDRYLAAAQRAAGVLLERFLDSARGGFWDIEDRPERLGYLRAREKPLAENVLAAAGMMRLNHATLEALYQQTAHHVLSAYVEANRDYGELAADYAVAVDRYLNPTVEVTVEGQPGRADADAMLAAALTLTDPNLLIKMAEAVHGDAPAQAHVCLDTVCYPPVTDPAALADAIANGGAVVESPFQNVLDLLG